MHIHQLNQDKMDSYYHLKVQLNMHKISRIPPHIECVRERPGCSESVTWGTYRIQSHYEIRGISYDY